MTKKFLLMILIKILMNEILMKKIKYKNVSGFPSYLLKYQKVLKLGAPKFHFPKYQKVCFRFLDFFYFSSFDWKVQGSIVGSIRKVFFRENIRILLEIESSMSGNRRNFIWVEFFWIFGFGLGSALDSCIIYYCYIYYKYILLAAKSFFFRVYVLDRTCFDKCFLFRDNFKTLFFIKVCSYFQIF